MAVAFYPLQAQPTPLLGRSAELETIARRLSIEGVRLLTLTGPGGVGKTRLVLEARALLIDHFPDGVTFVDLAPVRSSSLVLPAIAEALDFIDSGPYPMLERLQAYLRDREMLLILDNFEHLLPAATDLAVLVAAAPGLRMLVTSRVPLQLRWEQTLRLFPLPVPEDGSPISIRELVRIPSVALFVERARAQRADFDPTEQQGPVLIRLTRQLDGLPLAIELAAAQLNALPLAVIARRLDQQMQSLQWNAQDLPDRQRSLQAAIGWSYNLLSETEQRLFRHLGVFVGRVSLDAIEAVMGDTDDGETFAGMVSLAEKSLVLPGQLDDGNPEPSFGMLETVRQYACEQLEAQGELEAAGRAHARYFLELAERADPELRRRDQLAWYRRLEAEHDNVRAALRWLLDHEEHDPALRLAGALGYFWFWRGYFAEGWRWLEETLTRASGAGSSVSGRAYRVAGIILVYQGALDRSKALLETALALARESQDAVAIMESLSYLGLQVLLSGNLIEGQRMAQEALRQAEALQDAFHTGVNLFTLGYVSFRRGDVQEAASLFSASVARHQTDGDLVSATSIQFYLAWSLYQLGEIDRAGQLVQDGLQTCLVLQNRWLLCRVVEATLLIFGERANLDALARLLGARDALVQAIGTTPGIMDHLSGHGLGEGVAGLRTQVEQEGIEDAYRAGRSLSIAAIVNLAQTMVAEASQRFTHVEMPATEPMPHSPLSAREDEILRLVAEGLTSKQIGRQLFLSHRTVDHHLASIFNKLGVDTRAQAVAVAARDGLL